ncbi:MAG: signal peptidase I [Bacteroides sp.]|nr:signal peptidase I [Roseburia sp.]MCM1463645.1 signal peptidase I [Bacteroides sp.]
MDGEIEEIKETGELEEDEETGEAERSAGSGGDAAKTAPEETAKDKKPMFWAEALDWYNTVIGSVLAIILIFALLTRLSTVDGDSMLPTLHDGERLLVTNFLYTPAHNDIVVLWADGLFNEMTDSYGKAIVKRVIGVAGDTLRIDFAEGVVYRNDVPLEHEIADEILYEDGHAINDYTRERLDFYESVTIPEGYIFVMGDNRNNSTDSRDRRVGLVNVNDVIGRAYLRITPLERFGGVV